MHLRPRLMAVSAPPLLSDVPKQVFGVALVELDQATELVEQRLIRQSAEWKLHSHDSK